MPPTLPLPNWHIDPKSGYKDTTTALLIFIIIIICALLFGASFEKICRQHDDRMSQRDEGQALRTWSEASPQRKMVSEEEKLVGSEYDGEVDEWGLFPEKAAEAGDGGCRDVEGVCKEMDAGYGTFGL